MAKAGSNITTRVKPEYIHNLKGKDFVLYTGLLDLSHEMGLKKIETNILQFPTEENHNTCIVKASATFHQTGGDDKVFEGIGDAAPYNVNKMIKAHIIRMAETRAKARALRDGTNVGITALEELGGDDADYDEPAPKQETKNTRKTPHRRSTSRNTKKKEEDESPFDDTPEEPKEEPKAEAPAKSEPEPDPPENVPEDKTKNVDPLTNDDPISQEQKDTLNRARKKGVVTAAELMQMAKDKYNTNLSSLTYMQAEAIIKELMERAKQANQKKAA